MTWKRRISWFLLAGALCIATVALPQNTARNPTTPDAAYTWTARQTFNAGITVTGGVVGAPGLTRCINIDPASTTTSWLFYKFKNASTITAIDCIVDASTSVVLTLQECDSNAANCGSTEAAITCATTNTMQSGAIDDTAVDAGDWMRVVRGTVTGTITQAELCMTYTEP
jgi:hypothetical protein